MRVMSEDRVSWPVLSMCRDAISRQLCRRQDSLILLKLEILICGIFIDVDMATSKLFCPFWQPARLSAHKREKKQQDWEIWDRHGDCENKQTLDKSFQIWEIMKWSSGFDNDNMWACLLDCCMSTSLAVYGWKDLSGTLSVLEWENAPQNWECENLIFL